MCLHGPPPIRIGGAACPPREAAGVICPPHKATTAASNGGNFGSPRGASEEALHARIAEKRRRMAMEVMAKEQSTADRALAGLSHKQEKDKDGDGSNNSSNDLIRHDTCCVFVRYCRMEDGKGKGMGGSG